MPPQGPDAVLSAHIPNAELDLLEAACLDVEVESGDGVDRVASSLWAISELVQNGRLAGRVQAGDEEADLPAHTHYCKDVTKHHTALRRQPHRAGRPHRPLWAGTRGLACRASQARTQGPIGWQIEGRLPPSGPARAGCDNTIIRRELP
eukprot:scaffold14296_cov124-Isochrysis_galbana.AAC.1